MSIFFLLKLMSIAFINLHTLSLSSFSKEPQISNHMNVLDKNLSINNLKKISNEKELDFFLKNLPKQDKKNLRFLFESFYFADFAYTLFGDKPISFTTFYVISFFDNHKKISLLHFSDSYNKAFNPNNMKFKKCWATWKKYEHLFSKANFIFLEENNPLNSKTKIIFFINKKAFIKTFKCYKNEIQKVTKNYPDPEFILNKSLKNRKLFKDFFHKHEGLLGIFLGYGKNNALNYCEREKLYTLLEKKPSLEVKNKLLNLNQKLLPFAKKDREEIENLILENNFSAGHAKLLLQYIQLPLFEADPNDEETKILEQKYKEIRKLVIESYKDKNFLKTTLEKLIY